MSDIEIEIDHGEDDQKMLRRLRLPGKLVLAAVPLVVLLGALTAQFTLTTLATADAQDQTADLASLWGPLQAVIDTLAQEEHATLAAIDRLASDEVSAMRGQADLSEVRAATDASMTALRAGLSGLADPQPLVRQHEVATNAIVAVRAFFDESGTSPATQRLRIPESYDLADAQILELGDLMVAEVESVSSGRDLAAVSSLSRAMQAASVQDRTVRALEPGERLAADLETIRRTDLELTQWLSSFESAATEGWSRALAASPIPATVLDATRRSAEIVRAGAEAPEVAGEGWVQVANARSAALSDFQTSRIDSLVDRTTAAADDVRTQALVILGAIVGATLLAVAATTLIARSIVRRVRSVTESARQVTQEQLPSLVEALRDPRQDVALPEIQPIRDRGTDEIGDLARSFSAMQSTLEDVAAEQIEVLRKGVSEMFVTLARRNRSLVDRQLAMIDELEEREENPQILAEYYRLDHLATRMRRNAESLLVLAGSESKRGWTTPLEVDDVVRAALGEVEDYRRIDVLALESVRLQGGVVSDVAHLLSELLENATSFSPPNARVRIAGHFHDDGYLVTITDRGVGVSPGRLVELNALLESPPVIGLALEPTLGLYVVASLAKRHDIRVRLVSGAPGLTAHVTLPPTTFAAERSPRRDPVAHVVARRAPTIDRLQPLHRSTPVPTAESPPSEPVIEPRRIDPGSPQRGPAPAPAPAPAAAVANDADTGGLVDGDSLPVRRPGTSFVEPEEADRSVEASRRDPTELKTAFTAYQLGMSVGRASEGDEA